MFLAFSDSPDHNNTGRSGIDSFDAAGERRLGDMGQDKSVRVKTSPKVRVAGRYRAVNGKA